MPTGKTWRHACAVTIVVKVRVSGTVRYFGIVAIRKDLTTRKRMSSIGEIKQFALAGSPFVLDTIMLHIARL